MVRTGTVVEIVPEGIVVRFQKLAACEGCKACGREQDETTIVVKGAAQVGDVVAVELPEAKVLRASLLMYAVPLIGLIVGLLLAGQLSHGNEGMMALGSLLGLLLSGALLMFADKRMGRKREWQPRIVAINDPDMIDEGTACQQ